MSKSVKRLLRQAPGDKSAPEFQSFIYEFFTNKKKFKAPAHANLVGEGNRCQTSVKLNKRGKPSLEVPKLSLHQVVVSIIMKILAFNPTNTNRGLLAWHSTGSGKTLTATAVMDAFWDTDRHIIYVSSVEGKNSNPPESFYAYARKFFPRFRQRRFSSKDPEVSIKLVGEEFKKRQVHFMTFAQLAHFLLISKPLKSVKDSIKKEQHRNFLNNAIVIMDEVHNIFKPLPNQRAECDALRNFLMDQSNPRVANMKLVVLTATPGDSPKDILDLLNIVRDQTKPQIQIPDIHDSVSMMSFKEQIRGLVSFFDMSGDITKFPKVEHLDDAVSHMSPSHFEEYADAWWKAKKDPKQSNFEKLEKEKKQKNYLEIARKYSNMLFKVDAGSEMRTFSSKLADLIEQIRAYPNEKHYVYSSFFTKHGFGGQGIVAIAKLLNEILQYKELRSKEVTQAMINNPDTLEDAPRYVLATTPALTRESANAGKNLKKIVAIFNSKANIRGQKISVFLASQGYNEGVDLKGVRHIHIFEPLITLASEKQTIGRAARHCSHSDLDLEEWTVKVHRYYADKPLELNVRGIEAYEAERETLNNKITRFETELAMYKGIRSVDAKAARESIKKQVTELKTKIKTLEKDLSKAKKLNFNEVQMVDRVIRNEALERMAVLNALYMAVYETAVDCHLFKDFHAMAGYNIVCDPLLEVTAPIKKQRKILQINSSNEN